MDNMIDNRYRFVMAYANNILSLKLKLKKAKTNSEKQNINSLIANYKSYIDKYTDNSSDYILICAEKILSAKQKLLKEKDENKKEILEYGLKAYINNVKSHISEKIFISKETQFRYNSKIDIDLILQVNELSQMCEAHQKELKKEKQMRELLFKNNQLASGSER